MKLTSNLSPINSTSKGLVQCKSSGKLIPEVVLWVSFLLRSIVKHLKPVHSTDRNQMNYFTIITINKNQLFCSQLHGPFDKYCDQTFAFFYFFILFHFYFLALENIMGIDQVIRSLGIMSGI